VLAHPDHHPRRVRRVRRYPVERTAESGVFAAAMKTAAQHNLPRTGAVEIFESMMNALGYKFVTVSPSKKSKRKKPKRKPGKLERLAKSDKQTFRPSTHE